MTASADQSPRPPHAVTMWSDDHNIYVEMPLSAGGQPYITRLPLTEGGLSAALDILKAKRREVILPTPAAPANYTTHPAIKMTPSRQRLFSETTESQRANALAVLAKLGIK